MQGLDVIQNRAIHILRDARNTTQTPENFTAFENFQLEIMLLLDTKQPNTQHKASYTVVRDYHNSFLLCHKCPGNL